MTLPNLRPLSFGETLDRAFTLYRRNFALFVGTSLLTMVGVVIVAVVLGALAGVMMAVVPGAIALVFAALIFLGIAAVAMIPWGALTQQASQTYTGKRASLGDGLEAGGRSAMTLVGAGLLAGLTFGALMLVIFMITYILNLLVSSEGNSALSVVVSLVSALGIMAAFFFVAALFFGVVPAVVVEEKGPVDAVTRSLQLAQGALPRIAGTMLVSILITYLPILALMAVTGGMAALSMQPGASPVGMIVAVVIQQLLTLVISLLTLPFLLSVMVVLYYDRRVRTEALDVQILTEQLGLAGA
jgi:hypothetical protein